MQFNDKYIKVWKFENAPNLYKKLSIQSNDGDWVILLSEDFWSIDYDDGDCSYNLPDFIIENPVFKNKVMECVEVKDKRLLVFCAEL